jgi:3-hydroxy-9,10-secoandrosta-1,3,5(10)-triene-9,17-dione monooxygenase
MGTATPADGGYIVNGQWDYCSGVAHATHFMCNTTVPGRESRGLLTVCTPIDNVTVLPDWGNGTIIGMNSSGSNSVRVENVFVPEHCTCSGDWTHNTTQAAPGMALHDEPLFCGRIYAMYHAGLVIPVIGAARAALHEYEHIITTKNTYFAPQVPRYTVEEYQRHYGQALALTDSAEAIVLHCGERYMELARRWHAGGEPFTREDDARMYTMIQQAAQLAIRAVNELFGAASSSAAKRGTRMQRYFRDSAVYLGHISARHDIVATETARIHFGLEDGLF